MSEAKSIEAVIDGMVEIKLVGGPDGFRKIKETLMRMGVPSRTEKILNQSAHILHRRGQYYICHFKELLEADGLKTNIDDGDIARRNRIVKMLEDWGLIEVVKPEELQNIGHPSTVKVIRYADRDDWVLRHKYTIGTRKEDHHA